MAPKRSNDRALTVIVLDISPVVWGERDRQRAVTDKKRLAAGKKGLGQPALLEDCLGAVQAFCSAFGSLEREASLLIVAAAGNHVATVHPRKNQLESFFQNTESNLDTRALQSNLVQGVAELVQLAADDLAGDDENKPLKQNLSSSSQSAMASAFSIALCLINRFLVATNTGVSALPAQNQVAWERGNADDDGVLGAIGGGLMSSRKARQGRGWSPRILIVQASDDRPDDYNAIMNCAFAAVKHQVVVDGCFIPAVGGNKSSAFLEQTCDLTGGLFLAPSGGAQANKSLTEILLSVFLSPRSCRARMNLPANNKVDFRARSFDTQKIVDMAYTCSQCLSIFEKKPQHQCPTCGAEIRTRKQSQKSNAT